MPFDPAKLAAFKKSQGAKRLGGKGSARRKGKSVRKGNAVDERALKTTLQKLNCRDIPHIEEVNMFHNDNESVTNFVNPKVQYSIPCNTFVVTGNSETKRISDIPDIVNQLSADNLDKLKELYKNSAAVGDDDDVPSLVDNFEDVANDDSDDVPELV